MSKLTVMEHSQLATELLNLADLFPATSATAKLIQGLIARSANGVTPTGTDLSSGLAILGVDSTTASQIGAVLTTGENLATIAKAGADMLTLGKPTAQAPQTANNAESAMAATDSQTAITASKIAGINLSSHFSYAEMVRSATAESNNIDNIPDSTSLNNLYDTAKRMEQVRSTLGDHAIIVSSGYRSVRLNQLVGGSVDSAHLYGYACDFTVPSYGSPLAVAKAIAATGIQFDQLICELTWVHISFDPQMRKQLLTIDSQGTRQGLFAPRPRVN